MHVYYVVIILFVMMLCIHLLELPTVATISYDDLGVAREHKSASERHEVGKN